MKHLILSLFIVLSIAGYSQENKTEISNSEAKVKIKLKSAKKSLKKHFTEDLKDYLIAFSDKNWYGVTDKIYPRLFEFMNEEQMIATFENLQAMGMDMSFDFKDVVKLSKIIDDGQSKYCRIYYSTIVYIKVSGTMLENKEQFSQGLQMAYGIKNVDYNEDKQLFTVQAEKSMIAIQEQNQNDWKYIEYNEQDKAMLYQLFSKEVLKYIEE